MYIIPEAGLSSSVRSHINGVTDEILGEPLFEESQRTNYAQLVYNSISKDEMDKNMGCVPI
jgi:hypothetical protein